jgi:NADPH:quinone reductase-like Zn-dependent oxidoreductase
MKKVIYNRHGNLDVLQLTEVDTPRIADNTILVKVKAVSINPLDWKIVKGSMKPMSGFSFPKGVGIDFSGVIEDTGKSIKTFKTDDEVFGLLDVFKGGALAEYVTVSEKDIALKP